jgi:hypothetical protein
MIRIGSRRELVILAVALVGVTRFAEGPVLWLLAVLVLATIAVGTLNVLGQVSAAGVPIESLILPGMVAASAVGVLQLVPASLWLIPALALVGLLVDRTLVLEARLESAVHGPSTEDRQTVSFYAVVIAAAAFVGTAAVVPGGLEAAGPAGETGLSAQSVVTLAVADGIAAFLLGYRLSALRSSSLRSVLMSALTYAVVIAIGAGAIRVIPVKGYLGPALLTLVFFLWDRVHGASARRRRDPTWLWEMGILVALGIVVIVLNLNLAGEA